MSENGNRTSVIDRINEGRVKSNKKALDVPLKDFKQPPMVLSIQNFGVGTAPLAVITWTVPGKLDWIIKDAFLSIYEHQATFLSAELAIKNRGDVVWPYARAFQADFGVPPVGSPVAPINDGAQVYAQAGTDFRTAMPIQIQRTVGGGNILTFEVNVNAANALAALMVRVERAYSVKDSTTGEM